MVPDLVYKTDSLTKRSYIVCTPVDNFVRTVRTMFSGKSIQSSRAYRMVMSLSFSATASSMPGLSTHSLAKPLKRGVHTWFLKAQ